MPDHPVPECEEIWSFEQCPVDYRVADPMLEQATEGSIAGRLVRFMAGYAPCDRTFSRTTHSYQASTTLELGWAHRARSNAVEVLHGIATELPKVAAFAWGPEAARYLATEQGAQEAVDAYKMRYEHPPEMNWLLAGWAAIAGRPDVQALYARQWAEEHVKPVCDWMRERSLKEVRTLGAGVRALNTSHAEFANLRRDVSRLGEEAGREAFLAEYKGGKYLKRSHYFAKAFPKGERWDGKCPDVSAFVWPDLRTDKAGPGVKGPSSSWYTWGLVGLGVIALVGLGAGGFWFWRRRRKGGKR